MCKSNNFTMTVLCDLPGTNFFHLKPIFIIFFSITFFCQFYNLVVCYFLRFLFFFSFFYRIISPTMAPMALVHYIFLLSKIDKKSVSFKLAKKQN